MTTVQSRRDLIVWQGAMDLAGIAYELAARFPSKETYRLRSQITRAAASLPANIAEGNARGTKRDYANFLSVAKCSLMETETFLTLAVRLKVHYSRRSLNSLCFGNGVSKMLTSLRSKLREGADQV